MSREKMYQTAPLLTELLTKQHQQRYQAKYSGLFRQGVFTLPWRAKVGSFPSPDVETLISAGEPCGRWDWRSQREKLQGKKGHEQRVPEDFSDVGQRPDTIPLNGYIPGSAIRGIVRSWALKHNSNRNEVLELLGQDNNGEIRAGKIQFLDAWPTEQAQLQKDIVNPQEKFQVFHEGAAEPHTMYSLGNGNETIKFRIAIRGIPNKFNQDENPTDSLDLVWGWLESALVTFGIGSRTSAGYGLIQAEDELSNKAYEIIQTTDITSKEFDFELYSQGSAGPDTKVMELRPSHWRGWLRSWTLRFLLGVMSKNDAQITLEELFGTIESREDEIKGKVKQHRQGYVRLKMIPDEAMWGELSNLNDDNNDSHEPDFYCWKGKLVIYAPEPLLSRFLLPIIRFAVMLGGVGRGWRRPLHSFLMNNGKASARGSNLNLRIFKSGEVQSKNFGISPRSDVWMKAYKNWKNFVRDAQDDLHHWADRFAEAPSSLGAEVLSPRDCSVYLLPGPEQEPIDYRDTCWHITEPTETRGEGINTIYLPKYKRKIDVGGTAANGDSHCSWVSIKRVKIPNRQYATDCQEIVCLFLGGINPEAESNHLRSRFLRDLANIPGAIHLFGVQAPST